jgi:cytochrome c oxidase subunit 4
MSTKQVSSVGTYIVVWAILMVLLFATVFAAKIDLDHDVFPGANLVVAMIIALTKALVVVLWFMHVKDASKLTWVFAGASFIWLALLILGTAQDYHTRGWLNGWELRMNQGYMHIHSSEIGGSAGHDSFASESVGPHSGTAEPR